MAEKRGRAQKRKPAAAPDAFVNRAGLPARDSVREVVEFVSPRGKPYRILKTTETDAYDPPVKHSRRQKGVGKSR